MDEDSGRRGRNLPFVRDLRIFVVPIIMKNVMQGSVVEALDRTIALEKAAFDPFRPIG